MKCLLKLPVLLLVLSMFAWSGGSDEQYDYDFTIRGGTLYLGGFSMSGTGDVAILGDKIVAVGYAPGKARREIDATGLIVSPGFIDLHTHCDTPFQMTRGIPLPGSMQANLNYITQGVTTVVTGNCGTGYTGYTDVQYWLDRVDNMPFGTNVVHLVPHGQMRLRSWVKHSTQGKTLVRPRRKCSK